MCTMMLNNELNGVELYFESKPMQTVIDTLKAFKYRWNGKKSCWYAKQNDESLKIAKQLATGEAETVNNAEIKAKVKNTLPSLWERTQFTPGTVTENEYNYKSVGSNYNPKLSNKEIAAHLRKYLKERFPECKFSVTSQGYNSINCYIVSSPYANKKLEYSPELESYQYRDYEKEHNKELLAILEYAKKYVNSFNYYNSDPYSDYSDVNFYETIEIDYKYTQTEETEQSKAEIENFRLKYAEAQEQAEEQRKIEFQEYLKQQELDKIEAEKQAEQDKINKQIIIDNVKVNELVEVNQYMINNIKMAKSNKNNTYEEYFEQIEEGEFYTKDMKVTRELHFNTLEALELFKNMFLYDFDFITGTGGTYTDNQNFTSMTDYHKMSKSERESIIFNLLGIAVYYNNDLQFVIDAQGYDYCRYVGITDEAKKDNIKPIPELTVELQIFKDRAETIEDLSTEIIHNNNIAEFQTNEEYQALMIEALEKNNIILSKPIIRMVEIEELKVYLYNLLSHLNSVQYQFSNADLKPGDKITIISIDDMIGMTNTSRMIFDSYENTKYAQYNDAIKITGTPDGKRKLYYNHYHSNRNFLIVDGYVSIPDSVLWDESTSPTGLKVQKTKYMSCDIQQLIDIKNYLLENGYRIIIDRIRD